MGGPKSMQDIGPDMDDLLRRAAEGYPLKEPADDWDKVAAGLSGGQTVPVVEKPKKQRKFLWLLLLLIPAGLGMYFIPLRSGEPVTTQTTSADKTTMLPNSITGTNQQENAVLKPEAQQALQNKNDQDISKNELNAKGLKPVFNKPTDQSQSTVSIAQKNATAQNNISKDHHIIPGTNAAFQSLSNNDKNFGYSFFEENTQQLYGIKKVNNNFFMDDEMLQSNAFLSSKQTSEGAFDSSAQSGAIQPARQKRFYYGAVAGIGFSSVKHYGLKKMGYDFGLIAGYRFTSNFSIETGLLASQKYYMSRGEDFNKSKLGNMMQPGVKMMEVEGSSQVIGIPIHIKYDLHTKKSNRVYAKAGVSSFIMTTERNNYYTMNNGNPEMLEGIYKENKNYLAGTLDFAVGYEHNISKKLYLRIEPYVQIPMKHVGVGSLPVTSAGLHIGVNWPAH